MKSYLSLIPISAKIRKRQNRMTILCITLAVFLVSAIFGMADMGVRMESARLVEKHGNLSLATLFSDSTSQILFITSSLLFMLVLIAGILMISSSMNSMVAQRTKFFGMMRCIGMSRQQIIRYVRLEALNWCKTAIPVGVCLGIVTTWGLCAILRFIVGEEFSSIPLFGVSFIGIMSGIIVGIVTVLIAASSPAKCASKVSPVAAVSGDIENMSGKQNKIHMNFTRIETALGIHHATARRKNLFLITSSFALSIILFLCFSVLVNLVNYIMPQSSDTPDFTISSDQSNSIDSALVDEISEMKGIKHIFGRMNYLNLPVKVNDNANTIDIISYDDYDLDCMVKDKLLKRGSDISKVYGASNYAIAICDDNSSLAIGDKIDIADGKTVIIAGFLKCDIFNANGESNGTITLITSNATFSQLTGIVDYSLVMIQATNDITNEDVSAICNRVDNKYIFQDKRDEKTSGTYTAFLFFIYGFLFIIALVTILNIMNSISMSVTARVKQYGAMRAVGMDTHQITKMIASETITYAFCGCSVGCIIGLLLSKWIYDNLITTHYSYAIWHFPILNIIIILIFVFSAALVAMYAPIKHIHNMAIIDTINEL